MKGYIKMHLVENAPHDFGEKKKFAGVAGNLVAFACKLALKLALKDSWLLLQKQNLLSII